MRNLTLISSWDSFLQPPCISATTIDLDENVIYVASEHNTLDGQVEVGVWKMNRVFFRGHIYHVSESQITSKSSLVQISIFQTVISLNGPSNTEIISFRFMAESRRIAAIMRGGDVIMITIEEEGMPVQKPPVFPVASFSLPHRLK